MKNKKYIKLLRRSNYYLYASLKNNRSINSLDINLSIIIDILKEMKEDLSNRINSHSEECDDIFGLCEMIKVIENPVLEFYLKELFYSILPHKYIYKQESKDENEINNFVLYSKRRYLFPEADDQESYIENWYYYRLKWIEHTLKILKAEYKRKYDIQYELDF